jgi:hypothetical protein
MEKGPKNFNEDIFQKDWQNRTNHWIKEIRTCGIPDEFCEDLEISIEDIFLDKYINNLGRKDIELQVFLEDFRNQINNIPEEFFKQKEYISKIIEEDIGMIVSSQRN